MQAQRQLLEINLRTQRQNNAPLDFPNFVREGYDVTVVGDSFQVGGWVGMGGRAGGARTQGARKIPRFFLT